MNDAAVVGGGEPGAEFARCLDGLIGGQTSDAQEEGREVLSVHVLHGDEGHAFDLADIVDAAHIGMGDEARHAHFAVEAFEQALIARRLLG